MALVGGEVRGGYGGRFTVRVTPRAAPAPTLAAAPPATTSTSRQSTTKKRTAAVEAAATASPQKKRTVSTLHTFSPTRTETATHRAQRVQLFCEAFEANPSVPLAVVDRFRSLEELDRAWDFIEEQNLGCRLVYDAEKNALFIVELAGEPHEQASQAILVAMDQAVRAHNLNCLVTKDGTSRFRAVPPANGQEQLNSQEADQSYIRVVRVAAEHHAPTTLVEIGNSQSVGPPGTATSLLGKAHLWLGDRFGAKCVIVVKVYPNAQALVFVVRAGNPPRLEQVHATPYVPHVDLAHVAAFQAEMGQVPPPPRNDLTPASTLTLTREEVLGFGPERVQEYLGAARARLDALVADNLPGVRSMLRYIAQLEQVHALVVQQQQAGQALSLGPDLQVSLDDLDAMVH